MASTSCEARILAIANYMTFEVYAAMSSSRMVKSYIRFFELSSWLWFLDHVEISARVAAA
jgi:hypothetical protein